MSATACEVTYLSARVPLELRDALEESARQHDRSISAELRCALRAHLNESVRPGVAAARPPGPDTK
jgi:plasmid stability protein